MVNVTCFCSAGRSNRAFRAQTLSPSRHFEPLTERLLKWFGGDFAWIQIIYPFLGRSFWEVKQKLFRSRNLDMINLHVYFFEGCLVHQPRHTERSRAMTPPPGIEVKSNHFVIHQNHHFFDSWIFKVSLLFLLCFWAKKVQPSRRRQIWKFLEQIFFISRFFPDMTLGNGHAPWSLGRRSPSRSEFFRGGKLQRKVSTPSPRKKSSHWKIQRHRQVQESGYGEWNSRQRIFWCRMPDCEWISW